MQCHSIFNFEMEFFFQGTLKIAHGKPRTCVEMDPLGLIQNRCSSEIGNVTLNNRGICTLKQLWSLVKEKNAVEIRVYIDFEFN